jgi:hypothetical protein
MCAGEIPLIFFTGKWSFFSLREKPFFLEFALVRYYWFFSSNIKCTLEDMSINALANRKLSMC